MSTNPARATDNDIPTYFIDEGSHKFRTELPNLIDDLGLSVYAHRLYTHIKRRAGADDNGSCTAGLRGMAKSCGMSLGMAAKARQELLDLGLIRFRVEIMRHKDGGGRYEVLTVADVWPANFTFYARREQLKAFASDEARAAAARAHLICFLLERGHQVVKHRPKVKGAPPEIWGLEEARAYLATFLSDGGVSPHEHPPGGVLPRERGCSPHETPGVSPREHKKEPPERKTNEEHTHTARTRAAPARRPATDNVCVSSENGSTSQNISGEGSIFSFAERKAHAAAHGLGAGWLTNSRDGRYDEIIADARAATRSSAVEQSLREQSHPGTSYRAALLHIGSILDINPHLNIAGAIEQLDVSAETRAQLLAYDFTKRRAAGPQADVTPLRAAPPTRGAA